MKTKSNTYLPIFFIALAFFLFPQGVAHADVASILYIQGPGGTVLVNTSLMVPLACNVKDSAGTTHTFTGHKAPCAIQAAKDTGVITDFLFKDFGGLGLFLDRVNGIASGPAPDFPFWNLWRNGVYSDVGINEIVLSAGDTFQLTYGPWITGIVYPTQDARAGGPVVTGLFPAKFDVESAVLFLVKNQNEDGSFGSSALLTDWAGIALGSYEGYSATAKTGTSKLKEYLEQDPSPGPLLTDKIRRAMALQALSIDPYQGTKTNYITQILKEFDGEQFGNPNLVNDDIFALIVLSKAGYHLWDEVIQKTATFVLSWQKENGSWDSVDLTAAAVQALKLAKAGEEALLKARAYLLVKLEQPESFRNVYTTSWVLQAFAALKEPFDASSFASYQALDGGFEQGESIENRIWATSYAIPAALGKEWASVLVAFPKPTEVMAAQVPQSPAAAFDPVLASEIQAQLTVIGKETEVLTLKVMQFVLEDVSQKIAALEPRVLVFIESRESAFAFAQTEEILQVPQEVLVTAEPVVAGSQLAASVGETTRTQLPWQDLVPYIVAGGVLAFLLFGNPNVILSFLRGRLSKVGRV